MYKISVIMPIYNREKFLKKSINSIINQTIGFENIELILVDDNSKDNSINIIEEYESRYYNIQKILLKENHGVGYARNIGIRHAKSKYIMFLDSDDEYDSEICEKLFNIITNEDCDFVGCNYTIIDIATNYNRFSGVKFNTLDKITKISFPDIIYYKDILIWDKIFKKEKILKNNIFFKNNGLSEDVLFCMEYFINSKSLIHLNNYSGCNHYNHDTNMTLVSLEYNLNLIKSYYEVLNLFNKTALNVNLNKMFHDNIQATIERSILMKESEFKLIKYLLVNLYKFEKIIKFKNNYLTNPIMKIINYFILKNHITMATLLIFIIKLFSNNIFLKNTYRKVFHK